MGEIACEECGKGFVPRERRSRCCSPECRRIFYRKTHREDAVRRTREWFAKNHEKRRAWLDKQKKPPVYIGCKQCGKEIRKLGSRIFCTKTCQYKHRKQTNPQWYVDAYQRYKPRANAASMKRYHTARQKSPWQILVEVAKVRARQKNIPFDLTLDWAKERWTGRCELTDIPFVLGVKIRGPFSPSIDQIKPNCGYTKDNSRFIIWAINSMKGVGSDKDVFDIAQAIVDRLGSNNASAVLSLPG